MSYDNEDTELNARRAALECARSDLYTASDEHKASEEIVKRAKKYYEFLTGAYEQARA